MFKENLPKRGPLFREIWTQKPTHMGGKYPYPQHVMFPPGGGGVIRISVPSETPFLAFCTADLRDRNKVQSFNMFVVKEKYGFRHL